jgi:hypothetical protein
MEGLGGGEARGVADPQKSSKEPIQQETLFKIGLDEAIY